MCIDYDELFYEEFLIEGERGKLVSVCVCVGVGF